MISGCIWNWTIRSLLCITIGADANQKMKWVAIQSVRLCGFPKLWDACQCSRSASCACAKFIIFRWFRRRKEKPTPSVPRAQWAYLRRELHSFGKFNQQLDGNVCHSHAPWQCLHRHLLNVVERSQFKFNRFNYYYLRACAGINGLRYNYSRSSSAYILVIFLFLFRYETRCKNWVKHSMVIGCCRRESAKKLIPFFTTRECLW